MSTEPNYPPETWDVLVGRVKDRWDRALVRIIPFSDVPGRFAKGANLCLAKGSSREIFTVEVSNFKAGYHVCGLGLTSSEQADALLGSEVFVHRSMRPELPEGEFYPDELIGMKVETEDGEDLGEVEEVMETPHYDIYETPKAMIPAVPEFIVSKDKASGKIIVKGVAGLKIRE